MSTITLPNIRVSSDLTVKVRLKDGGVAIDWSTLSNIRALIYSDAQKAMAGRCVVTVDAEDATLLVCQYAATKPQYIGVNRIVISATYMNEMKTYDKPALNFVRWTDDQAGQEITISDPDVEVEIEVEDISSSILQEAVDAAFSAAERADEAAAAAEHMVDIHQGPPGPAGKAPYIDETTGNWFVWDDDEDAYVDSEIHAQGVAGNGIASWSVVESDQDGGSNVVTVTFTDGNSETFTYKNGHTGATPQISIGTVETGAAGSEAEASMTGTAAAPLLNLKIPKGDPGVAEVCYKHVTTLPTAAAGTMNALYLVDTQTANVYDVYYTSYDGSAYSWVQLGTTTVNLSDYATKAEVNQLEAEKADKDTVRAYMMTIRAKNALLAVFDKVAFAFPDVSAEMEELENSLFNLDEIVGIEATYNQGDTVVYDQGVSILDELGDGLVVKAVYGDNTKVPIHSYTLSGDISTAGTQTVTASFLGFTDTFEVEVTHYTAQMVFKISTGDITSYKGTIGRYDNNTKYCINDYGTSTNRRVFLADSGDAPLTKSSGTSIGKYPIPIPRNARKVTVTVTPSATLNIGIATGLLNGTVYEYVTDKSYFTSPSDGGIVQNFSDARFDSYRKGGWYLLVLCTPDSSFSGNEPTESVVTFE